MNKMLNLRALKRPAWPGVVWIWALALLALPNCADIIGLEPWDPNDSPTTLVFCDLPKPDMRQCIAPSDIGIGIRQAAAALALNTGDTNTIMIDESDTALADCAATTGGPQSVLLDSQFPQGTSTCFAPSLFTDANSVCVAFCKNLGGDPSFCNLNARASTNVPLAGYPGACGGEGGGPSDLFVDPRPIPEPIEWDPDPASLIGVDTGGGNNLHRSANTSDPPDFDAGGASTQQINNSDAYVEFSAENIDISHVIGLSEIPDGCAPCTDTDPSYADISFGLSLNYDNHVYVIESGVLVTTGPDLNGSFGTYNPVERYRVSLEQSADGSKTAIVKYSRLTAVCNPGNPCQEDVFYTSEFLAHYPLRVDASFREVNAGVKNVTVMRIK